MPIHIYIYIYTHIYSSFTYYDNNNNNNNNIINNNNNNSKWAYDTKASKVPPRSDNKLIYAANNINNNHIDDSTDKINRRTAEQFILAIFYLPLKQIWGCVWLFLQARKGNIYFTESAERVEYGKYAIRRPRGLEGASTLGHPGGEFAPRRLLGRDRLLQGSASA